MLIGMHGLVTANCIEGSVRLLPTTTSEKFYMDPTMFPKGYFIKDKLRVGRVEVCSGGMYKTICDDNWDDKDASIVCHQLGFSRYGKMFDLIKNFPWTYYTS